MRKVLLSTVTALTVLGFSAQAFADATATSGAGAESNAGAAAVVNQFDQSTFTDNSKTNAEPAIAPNLSGLVATPATCMGSVTASGAGGGIFAFGVGSTYTDKECERREALKLAAHLGLNEEAKAIFFSLDAVQDALGAPKAAASRETARASSTVITAGETRTARADSDSPYLLHRLMAN